MDLNFDTLASLSIGDPRSLLALWKRSRLPCSRYHPVEAIRQALSSLSPTATSWPVEGDALVAWATLVCAHPINSVKNETIHQGEIDKITVVLVALQSFVRLFVCTLPSLSCHPLSRFFVVFSIRLHVTFPRSLCISICFHKNQVGPAY